MQDNEKTLSEMLSDASKVPPVAQPSGNKPVTSEDIRKSNVDLERAKVDDSLLRPEGTNAAEPQTVEDADEARERNELPPEVPPLKAGDRVQGPNDRKNRAPTERELEHGKRVAGYGLTEEEKAEIASRKPKVVDPPIDPNAPEDKPADPREVARGRGLLS